MSYKCAIIGVGKAEQSHKKGGGHQIGSNHAKMIQANPRTTLVAGADINADNLKAFQERFGVEKGYHDYREMLREVQPDIVSICTYVGLHEEMVLACAEAGVKGIYLEKPLLHSPAALQRVNEAVAQTGLKICSAHIRRHLPAMRKVRELLTAGAIGRPLMFMAGISNWDLSEWGSHWLDIFRFFHDEQPIDWVMAQARVRETRGYGHAMEDHAVVTWEFADGARGYLDGGQHLGKKDPKTDEAPPTLTVTGTRGTLYVTEWLKKVELFGETGREVFEFDMGEPFELAWHPYGIDLTDWLDGNLPEGVTCPPTGWDRTRGTAELNLAAYVSILRSDRVDLPLSDDADALAIDEWPVEILARRRAQTA